MVAVATTFQALVAELKSRECVSESETGYAIVTSLVEKRIPR